MINIVDIAIYILSFLAIWVGSGKIVTSIDKIAHRIRISTFAVSFIVLGLATSVPEFAVGITSISQGKTDIFVGNLIGGVALIFLFIIPLLAILGNGINFGNSIHHKRLLLCLFITITPLIFLLDKSMSQSEALFEIGFYFFAFLLVKPKYSLQKRKLKFKFKDLAWLAIGLTAVYISANFLVGKTSQFAQVFNVTPFLISLVLLSLGTNLPELFVAIRSLFLDKGDVALGDYVGSALANVLFFGIFTFMLGGSLTLEKNFLPTLAFLSAGLILFYHFIYTKKSLSRREGFILIMFYLVFTVSEALRN